MVKLATMLLALVVVPPLSERLSALDPGAPLAYLEAGEDAARDGEIDLARQLFRRCGALAAAKSDSGMAASAALGMASLEDPTGPDGAWSRWRALARMLAPSRVTGNRTAPDADRLRFAELISHYRAGRSLQAQRLGRDPSCVALAREWGALLPGGGEGFIRACTGLSASAPPQLSPRQSDQLLAVESALLARTPRAVDELRCGVTAPVPEVDARHPDGAFGIDDASWWWRDGRWSSTK
ncbi:MAG: hypothetical protein FJ254_04520 [Phycisphaerae bacterium]|nr:hypothetical protein [Phycisphaerae bacterium]